jgi:GT2 family glycosyltransferase
VRGTAVEQPAAAALALRRSVLREIGGLDEGFYPAWFEDVDLARRLTRAGHQMVYEPAARFAHAGGATVEGLGYGPFLWLYYRGLNRYLGKHHGAAWSLIARLTLPLGMLLRLALLPLRRPRRAAGRLAAAAGLLAVIAGAASGWRRPLEYARRFEPQGAPET